MRNLKYILADLIDTVTYPIRLLGTNYYISLHVDNGDSWCWDKKQYNFLAHYLVALIYFKLKYGSNKLIALPEGQKNERGGSHVYLYPDKKTWVDRHGKFKPRTTLDYSAIDDIEVGNVRGYDAPKFCDAMIERASYRGRDMSENELDALNEDSEYVHEAVQNYLY